MRHLMLALVSLAVSISARGQAVVNLDYHTMIADPIPFDLDVTFLVGEGSNAETLCYHLTSFPSEWKHFYDGARIKDGRVEEVCIGQKYESDSTTMRRFDAGKFHPGAEYTITLRGGGTSRKSSYVVGGSINDHFETDVGIYSTLGVNNWGLGTAVHYFIVPIQPKQKPTSYRKFDHIFKRVSIFGALVVTQLDSRSDIKTKFALGNPIVGVGFSHFGNTPWVKSSRFNVGVMFFKQDDPDPLVTKSQPKTAITFGYSLEFDIKNILGPLSKIF